MELKSRTKGKAGWREMVQATRQPADSAEHARRMYGGGAAAHFDDDL